MKKKSNINVWSIFIILFLLFQLGKFAFRNDWFSNKQNFNQKKERPKLGEFEKKKRFLKRVFMKYVKKTLLKLNSKKSVIN